MFSLGEMVYKGEKERGALVLKTSSCVFKLGLAAENQKDLARWCLREFNGRLEPGKVLT